MATAARARSWSRRRRISPRLPGPPGVGPLLGLSLGAIALIACLGWRLLIADLQGQAAAGALNLRLSRGMADTVLYLQDTRSHVRLIAEAATDTAGLADAIGAKSAPRTLELLEGLRKTNAVSLLAVVDGSGRLLAADPATNVPLATTAPVRRALAGQSAVATIDGAGSLAVLAASPVRQGDRSVGAVLALQALDDHLMDTAERGSDLSGAILLQGQPIAATRLIRARYNQSHDQAIKLDPPSSAGGRARLTVGGTTFSVVSQELPSLGSSNRPVTLVVGEPVGEAGVPITSWRFWLDWGSPLIAGLVAGVVGWLIGARLGRAIVGLGEGREISSGLVPREVIALSALLAEERINAAARTDEARSQIDRFRGVFDALPDGVIVCGPDRSLILANSVAQRMLGLTGGGGDGDVIARLPPPDGKTEFHASARALRSYSAPLGGAGGTLGVVTVLHDTTAENESERLKSEFLSVVSHELQTPLAAISGATDLLLDGDPGTLNEDQTRFLSSIRRNGQRLSALVSDLLDVSRLEAGRVELDRRPVDLGMLARSGVRSMANLFEQRSQTLTVKVADGVPPALGDRRRIEQILANLLANAGQYTPMGSQIEVEVVAALGPGGAQQVVLSVSDDGPGISPSDQARIFDEFYRGDNAATRRDRGSGLGLSIVRSLADLHGGRVWVESRPGEGARFSVALPIATEEDE